jgi:hypothetical protein
MEAKNEASADEKIRWCCRSSMIDLMGYVEHTPIFPLSSRSWAKARVPIVCLLVLPCCYSKDDLRSTCYLLSSPQGSSDLNGCDTTHCSLVRRPRSHGSSYPLISSVYTSSVLPRRWLAEYPCTSHMALAYCHILCYRRSR